MTYDNALFVISLSYCARELSLVKVILVLLPHCSMIYRQVLVTYRQMFLTFIASKSFKYKTKRVLERVKDLTTFSN